MHRRTRTAYKARRSVRRPRWLRIAAAAFVFCCVAAAIYLLAFPPDSGREALRTTATPLPGSPSTAPSPSVLPSEPPTAEQTPPPANAPTPEPTRTPSADPTPTVKPASSTPSPAPTASPAQINSQADSLLQKAAQSFGSSQAVVVLSSGNRADVTLYTKSGDGAWQAAVSAQGCVGRNGVSASRKEGDGTTPAGTYRLGFAFGNSANPGTKLAYRDVTSKSYWVDDASSKYYNQWVEGTQNKDWDSAEALAQAQTAYAYAVVVEYNYGANAIAGKGSAIFLHCGSSPTSGCIAIPQSKLISMLKLLDPEKKPVIAIAKKK